MTWKKYTKGIDDLLIRLTNDRWGVFYLAFVFAIILFLLGIYDKYTLYLNTVVSVFFGLSFSWLIISVKKRGMEKTMGLVYEYIFILIDLFISVVSDVFHDAMSFIDKIAVQPFRKFFFKTIPNKMAFVLRPLYFFLWYAGIAAVIYQLCWWIFKDSTKPEDFFILSVGGTDYKIVVTGLVYVGIITGWGFLEFIFTYLGMFLNWLRRFRWGIQFIIKF